MKHSGTHSCGHEGSCYAFGRVGDQMSRVKLYFSKPCPECDAQEDKKRAMAAVQSAIERGLPVLLGDDSSVALASEVRDRFIEQAKRDNLREKGPEIAPSIDHLIKNRTSAFLWTMANYKSAVSILRSYIADNREAIRTYVEEQLNGICKPAVETNREATLSPEAPMADDAAEIRLIVDDDEVSGKVLASYRYDETFRNALGIKYKWDGEICAFYRSITFFSGTVRDRAAELACKLMDAGFRVVLRDEQARQMALSRSYKAEQRRWIVKEDDSLYIRFPPNFKLKAAVMTLPACEFVSTETGYEISLSAWRELMDFADVYDFRLTPDAQATIDACEKNGVTLDALTARPVTFFDWPDKLKSILDRPTEVLEHLKDDV